MTDTEKVTLSREIAEAMIAQAFSREVAWQEQWMCAQNHDPDRVILGRCEQCYVNFTGHGFTEPQSMQDSEALYDLLLNHPEWKLSVREMPQDFTQYHVLIPAVKAWIARQPHDDAHDWNFSIGWGASKAVALVCRKQGTGPIPGIEEMFTGTDNEDEMVALAQAFLQAIKAGKEQAND